MTRGWKPIRTAPRDGTVIDLWIKAKDCAFRAVKMRWDKDQRTGEVGWIDDESERILYHAYVNVEPEATHWMPMPEGPPVDPVKESDGDFLARVKDDAALWASEFRKAALRSGYSDMDEGWLIGWFANAIENTEVVRRDRWRKLENSLVDDPFCWVNEDVFTEFYEYDGPAAGKQLVLWFDETDSRNTHQRIPLYSRPQISR